MLYFERGKDPKETLEVGVKKDAIKITGVGYLIEGNENHIKNPIKAKIFLDRLKNGDLPKDSIFGIESVFVWHDERDMEEDWQTKVNRQFHGGEGNEYKEVKNTRTYELDEICGHVMDMCGKLIIFPTLEELEKAGFGHLEEYRKGDEMVREEEARIDQYLYDRKTELFEKDKQEAWEKIQKEKERKEERKKIEKEIREKELRLKPEEKYGDYVEAKKGFGDWLKGNWSVLRNGDEIK